VKRFPSTYDALNRLTNLGVVRQTYRDFQGVTHPQTSLLSYGYTLGAAGNRTSVTELSGRTVSYGYDDLYRLISETIANAPPRTGRSAIPATPSATASRLLRR
jgi:YD repeat-containing protein